MAPASVRLFPLSSLLCWDGSGKSGLRQGPKPFLSARLISVSAFNCLCRINKGQIPNSATILKFGQGQSAGNNILRVNRQMPLSLPFYPLATHILSPSPQRGEGLVVRGWGRCLGSSETPRVTSYSRPFPLYDIFGSWLAGLIDGDGSLLLSNNNVVSVEITLDAKDIQCLHKIKTTLGFGSIIKRTGVNAFRYRIYKKEHVVTLLHLINGYLLTVGKQAQLAKLCSFFNIIPFFPDYPTSLLIIKNSSWLAGFFDAEGHFTVMNKFTLTCNISQKDKLILESIKDSLQLGHVRYDKSWDGWVYTISNKEGIRFILDLFTPKTSPQPALRGMPPATLGRGWHPIGLCTLKSIDVCTFKRLLYKIDCKYHLKNNPRRIDVENLIALFKKRNQGQLVGPDRTGSLVTPSETYLGKATRMKI
jgi:LAGLIDADG endonuclease